MRTHSMHTGEGPAGQPRVGHARVRYLETPANPEASAEVTHDQIAHRAYELYLARGGREGDALGDWLAAERELRAGTPVLPPFARRADSELAH